MTRRVAIELELPDESAGFHLPPGVQARLQSLLDRQDRGIPLTIDERREAESLVELTEILTLLMLRAVQSPVASSAEVEVSRESNSSP